MSRERSPGIRNRLLLGGDGERPPLRIGHRGAAALAPANTLASLEAALAIGVDGIEVDVVRMGDRVVLAHSRREWASDAPAFDDALAFLADRGGPDLLLVVDVKRPGVEAEVVAALRRRELVDRALVTSYFPRALRAVRTIEPALETGIGYPADRTGLGERYVPEPAVVAAMTAMRRILPLRIGRMVAGARASAAMIHHLAISSALVARCRGLGVPLIAWTVNDVAALRRLEALGVDGVVSDDPRIFARGNKSAAPGVYDPA